MTVCVRPFFSALFISFLPVGVGASVTFSSTSKEGAVLALPNGASALDLRPTDRLKEYALKHGASWYEFVNGTLRRGIPNGSLYFVTGCDKTSSWGVASVSNISTEGEVALTFKNTQLGGGSASFEWQWETCSPAAVRTGPELAEGERNPPQNQCVFLRGYKVAVRENPVAKLMGPVKASFVVNSKPEDILSNGSSVPFVGSSKTFARRFNSGNQSGSPQDSSKAGECVDDEVVLEVAPGISEVSMLEFESHLSLTDIPAISPFNDYQQFSPRICSYLTAFDYSLDLSPFLDA